jgi:methylmalonyl-CoA mutase
MLALQLQQIAYSLGHVNEYFNRVESISTPIVFEIAVGTNYFFEIAKCYVCYVSFLTIAKEYNHAHRVTLSLSYQRNKTYTITT